MRLARMDLENQSAAVAMAADWESTASMMRRQWSR